MLPSPFFHVLSTVDGTIVLTPNKEGRNFMSSHEFDTWLETQPLQEPPYHEQMLVMHEMEEAHETNLKRLGAIEALYDLKMTLTMLCLRDDVQGDYYFGMHDALEVVRGNLDVVRGGVA